MKQLMLTPKDFIGKDEETATKRAKSKGFTVRVVERDGRGDPMTLEHRSDRVNFRIKNGFVVDAFGG